MLNKQNPLFLHPIYYSFYKNALFHCLKEKQMMEIFPSAGSLLHSPQQLGLGQTNSRSQTLSPDLCGGSGCWLVLCCLPGCASAIDWIQEWSVCWHPGT